MKASQATLCMSVSKFNALSGHNNIKFLHLKFFRKQDYATVYYMQITLSNTMQLSEAE